MNKLFTTGQIADYCGVDYHTIIRWINQGNLKAFQLPGRGDRRISKKDFIEFLTKFDMPIPDDLKPDNTNRILIVDDDESMAKSIQRQLKQNDFETLIANNGFEAGALMGTYAPNIVTLDLQMPGMDGYEVLEFIRNNTRLKHLKILVISGLPENKLLQAIKMGANDVLTKPFENELLIEKVMQLAPR